MLKITEFDDGKVLGQERIHPTTMGMIVDYLTRWQYGDKIDDAFQISIFGGIRSGKLTECMGYVNGIVDMSDDSILNACKAVTFDSYTRTGMPPTIMPEDISIDHNTCENVRIMVERGVRFLKEYGPIIESGFRFPGGYTNTVDSGDGDFITKDTLWDFKVSKNPPTKDHTLQLAMYYIMGKHSINDVFDDISKIGIYNPRLDRMYTLDMDEVDSSVIGSIEKDVIGY